MMLEHVEALFSENDLANLNCIFCVLVNKTRAAGFLIFKCLLLFEKCVGLDF